MGEFVDERDWGQFHNPKDLAVSIAIEAAELLEIFRWSGGDTLPGPEEATKARIAEEVSDIVIYCLSTANALDLDLSKRVVEKLQADAERYPAGVYRGRSP